MSDRLSVTKKLEVVVWFNYRFCSEEIVTEETKCLQSTFLRWHLVLYVHKDMLPISYWLQCELNRTCTLM
jgi:hypothetical protein